jgi:hypothetical protein
MASTKQMQSRAKALKQDSKLVKKTRAMVQNLTPYVGSIVEMTKGEISQSHKRYQDRFGKRYPLTYKALTLEQWRIHSIKFHQEYSGGVKDLDFSDRKVYEQMCKDVRPIGLYIGDTMVGMLKLDIRPATNKETGSHKVTMLDVIHVFSEYSGYGIATKVYQTIVDNQSFADEFLGGAVVAGIVIEKKRVIMNAPYWMMLHLGRLQNHPEYDAMCYLMRGHGATEYSTSINAILYDIAKALFDADPMNNIN